MHVTAVLILRTDILVNNAGIIRDRSIAKLTDQDWGESITPLSNSLFLYSDLLLIIEVYVVM